MISFLIPVTLSTLNYGVLVGWTSPVQHLLQSTTHPALGDIPLSDNMIALAGAMVYCGATLGCCFWGLVANRVGRKPTSILIVLPYVVSWSLLCFTNNRNSLYLARMIGGIGNAGGVINTPMYIAEVCTPRLRDRLGPLLVVSSCVGTLYAYLCGWLLPFQVFNLVNLAIAVASLLLTFYLPESPVYYLKCNKLRLAKKSLVWLRHYKQDDPSHSRNLERELNLLESSFLNKDSLRPWHDLLIPSTRNALLLGFGLISGIQFSGIAMVTVNAASIFRLAQVTSSPPLSPHLSSLILASLQLLGSLAALYLVKRFNRKPLLVVTYACIALSLLILGAFYYMKAIDSPYLPLVSSVPLVSLSVYIISYYAAAGPVSFIILAQIFPAETRNLCMGLVVVYQHVLMFALIILFPLMRSGLGMYGCIWTYAIASCVTVVYIHFCVPETRKKSFRQIVTRLSEGKLEQLDRKKRKENKVERAK